MIFANATTCKELASSKNSKEMLHDVTKNGMHKDQNWTLASTKDRHVHTWTTSPGLVHQEYSQTGFSSSH